MYTKMYDATLEGLKQAEDFIKRIGDFLNENSAIILNAVWRIIVFFARIFVGALVIETLAGINPQLREMVPSLYRCTGIILQELETICNDALRFAIFWLPVIYKTLKRLSTELEVWVRYSLYNKCQRTRWD